MSEVKRFSLDMQFAKSQVKHDSEGELCFYRDYAALQQKLEQATLTYDYQQDQINYWNDISRQQAEENADLQQKLDAVLAENVALKGYIESECYIVDDNSGPMADADVCATERMPKSPVTDAILNEARAEGVEMVRNHPAISLCSLTHVCDEIFTQLRTGSTEGGV